MARNSISICVSGHSYIKRLHRDLCIPQLHESNVHFGLDNVKVTWHYTGGLTIDSFMEKHYSVIQNLKPNIVFLQLGENDMDSYHINALDIASDLIDLAQSLRDSGVQHVIIGQLFQRYKCRSITPEQFNAKILIANQFLDLQLNQDSNHARPAKFWKHIRLQHSRKQLMDPDKVHLMVDPGLKRLYRSIRGALLKTKEGEARFYNVLD